MALSSSPEEPHHRQLSRRQWQAALLLLEGMSNQEIAEHMNIEPRTAKALLARLFTRFHCGNACKRVQCAVKLYRFLLEKKPSSALLQHLTSVTASRRFYTA